MAAAGRYRRDLPPIMIRLSFMYGEAERHPEPFPQERFGVRTRPAVPLGRRKPAPPARLRTRGRGLPSPDSVLRPGGSRGVRVPPAVSVLSVGLNRYLPPQNEAPVRIRISVSRGCSERSSLVTRRTSASSARSPFSAHILKNGAASEMGQDALYAVR